MDLLHAQCAGLDLAKDSLMACARFFVGPAVHHEVRTFGTTTKELLALSEWLTEHQITHVAMEATGVYWKPVWHILEGSFTLVLANAGHIKNVPGRKSDVSDAMWIADLLAHGLIRSSFVPPTAIQELRDLTRTRKQLVREIAQHTLRIQKTLEDANLKLCSVLTDVLGVTGRAILKAIIEGESNPEKLAELARGSLKKKKRELAGALHGRVTSHHRTLFKLHLALIDAIEGAVKEVDAQIGAALEPFRWAGELLKTIPGISDIAARSIISEIGYDMTRFRTHQHLISWACLCPRMEESAGRKKSTRTRKGACWLKSLLVQCAWAAVSNKGPERKGHYLRSQFFRLKSRRGPKKAIMAVAASMLTAIYYVLRDGTEYRDLGHDYFDKLDSTKLKARLVRKLQELGCEVTIKEAA